jgi:hypothetical protein
VLSKFKENLEIFKDQWRIFSRLNGGRKINESEIFRFFQTMKGTIGMINL